MKKESAFQKIEKKVIEEEKKIGHEIRKDEKAAAHFIQSHTFKIIILTVVFGVLLGGLIYLTAIQDRVYIEKSEISAPIISLSPASSGILEKVFVKEGDIIPANTVVAQVSGSQIRSEIGGLVIKVQDTPGQIVSQQTPIVQMIDQNKLRVVGHLAEDKGLKDIHNGQHVVFTVDAFGSEKFNGTVESISPASRDSAILFSISDKRPEKEFDVKIKYDNSVYSQFKNGMSAKMWVYK